MTVPEFARPLMPAIFHFEFRGDAGWEPIGAGLGAGEDPVREALEEVRQLSGGTLPAGFYQVIEARSGDTRWQTFSVDSIGRVHWW